jgi:cyanophycin synthetase
VLIDYAHNPDGLRGFLKVANHLRGGAGRLALLLGHAGNRKNEDIEALARVAAEFRPDLVVIKENEAHRRGRAPGEIPGILRGALRRSGLPDAVLHDGGGEIEAAKYALAWAQSGDVLALPLHALAARNAVTAILEHP